MYDIIPLVLILISLAVIIIIIARKFSVLASVDLNTIQAEREARIKERIAGSRLKKKFYRWGAKAGRLGAAAGRTAGSLTKRAVEKLTDMKDNYTEAKRLVPDDTGAAAESLIAEGIDLRNEERYDEAEKKFIEAISLDARNLKAFRELADLYRERKDYEEAAQTLEHILRLLDSTENGREDGDGNGSSGETEAMRAGVYYDLCLIHRGSDNTGGALAAVGMAVEIEPNNPRYLDTMLEMSIIKKDKVTALEVYEKLKEVNPENKKLTAFKKQIRKL